MLFPPGIVQTAIECEYESSTDNFASEVLDFLANNEHTPPLLAKYMGLFEYGSPLLKKKVLGMVVYFYKKVIAEMRPGRIDLNCKYYNPKPHVDKTDPLQHPRGINMLNDFYVIIVQEVFTLVEGRGVSCEESVTHSN
jgi:hypothetical protein